MKPLNLNFVTLCKYFRFGDHYPDFLRQLNKFYVRCHSKVLAPCCFFVILHKTSWWPTLATLLKNIKESQSTTLGICSNFYKLGNSQPWIHMKKKFS